ncbi:MAG: hypothetical protein ABI036_11130 [Fibrobacteria bacterium]
MGFNSILDRWFAKDGKMNVAFALQVSAFLFFADLCFHRANVQAFAPWISTAENIPSLFFALVFLLALYSFLSGYLIPFFVQLLTFAVPTSLSGAFQSDFEARRSVLKDQYERFAVETGNAAMLAQVTHLKEERPRHFQNVGLFLMWMWLLWGELRYCLSVSGTVGNGVLPLPFSPWVNGIGALICLGITVLLVIGSAKNRSSSRILVSRKLRMEIEEREKEPAPAGVKNSNLGNTTFNPITFPPGPMSMLPWTNKQ